MTAARITQAPRLTLISEATAPPYVRITQHVRLTLVSEAQFNGVVQPQQFFLVLLFFMA